MPLVKFQADDELAERVMEFTGYRVASKAFSWSAEQALRLNSDLLDARTEIERLRNIVKRQQQVLDQARDAAAVLVEAASQGDLFFART